MTAPWEANVAAPGPLGVSPAATSGVACSAGAPSAGPLSPASRSPGSLAPKIGKRKYKKGKYRGVRERGQGRWVAEIKDSVTGQRQWLGTFETPEAAALAFDSAAREIRGPGAKTNFPKGTVLPGMTSPDTTRLTSPSSLLASQSSSTQEQLGAMNPGMGAPFAGSLATLTASLLTPRQQKPGRQWQVTPAAPGGHVAFAPEPAASAPLPTVSGTTDSFPAMSSSDSMPSFLNMSPAGTGSQATLQDLSWKVQQLPASLVSALELLLSAHQLPAVPLLRQPGASPRDQADPRTGFVKESSPVHSETSQSPPGASVPQHGAALNTCSCPPELQALMRQALPSATSHSNRTLSRMTDALSANLPGDAPFALAGCGSAIARDNLDSFDRTFSVLAEADVASDRWLGTAAAGVAIEGSGGAAMVDAGSITDVCQELPSSRQDSLPTGMEGVSMPTGSLSLGMIEDLLMD